MPDTRDIPVDAAILTACYEALLGRSPDAVALAHWTGGTGSGNLRDLLATVGDSEEFAARIGGAIRHRDKVGSLFVDRSQFGEVGFLIGAMVNASARHRIVVDVGANGRERSNSYDFMRFFGWRGLLVEADERRLPVIMNEFSGLDFKLVNCAVSDYTGSTVFFLGVNDDVSSINVTATESWGPVAGKVEVAVRPLSAILAEHSIPVDFDYLSIDAEGEDARILNETVAAGYRPEWVILEKVGGDYAAGLSPLVHSHYHPVGETVANAILRRRSQRTDGIIQPQAVGDAS